MLPILPGGGGGRKRDVTFRIPVMENPRHRPGGGQLFGEFRHGPCALRVDLLKSSIIPLRGVPSGAQRTQPRGHLAPPSASLGSGFSDLPPSPPLAALHPIPEPREMGTLQADPAPCCSQMPGAVFLPICPLWPPLPLFAPHSLAPLLDVRQPPQLVLIQLLSTPVSSCYRVTDTPSSHQAPSPLPGTSRRSPAAADSGPRSNLWPPRCRPAFPAPA